MHIYAVLMRYLVHFMHNLCWSLASTDRVVSITTFPAVNSIIAGDNDTTCHSHIDHWLDTQCKILHTRLYSHWSDEAWDILRYLFSRAFKIHGNTKHAV